MGLAGIKYIETSLLSYWMQPGSAQGWDAAGRDKAAERLWIARPSRSAAANLASTTNNNLESLNSWFKTYKILQFQHRGRLCRVDNLAAAMATSLIPYLEPTLEAESALHQAKALHFSERATDKPEAADLMKESSQTVGSSTPAY